jgi:hypothetical protein
MDLQSLRQALKPLEKFGQDEFSFDVEGLQVSLRPLLPHEEVKCQKHAAQILKESAAEDGLEDEDELTRATTLRYFDQFRAEVISYALVQVGVQDLRGTRHVETGEVLENGVKVKEPLQKALRGLINTTWSRAMITICFSRYGDMVTKIAEKADRIAKDSISDLDAEIDRVAMRLENLKSERAKRASGDPSVTTQQIQALVRAGEALDQEIDDAIQTSRADRDLAAELEEIQEDLSPPPPPREPVIPKNSPPPTAAPKPPKPHAKVRQGFPEVLSSFGEAEDEDSMAIENARIFAAQRAAYEVSRRELEAGSLSHAEAAGKVRTGSGEEIDAYRLPSQTISERGRQEDRSKAKVNPDPKAGTLNPKFNPPRR